MPALDSLKLASAARPLVDRLLARASTASERSKIEQALVAAASVDRNKVLSAKEVQAIADSFETAQPGSGIRA